jgi:hypothetical protein
MELTDEGEKCYQSFCKEFSKDLLKYAEELSCGNSKDNMEKWFILVNFIYQKTRFAMKVPRAEYDDVRVKALVRSQAAQTVYDTICKQYLPADIAKGIIATVMVNRDKYDVDGIDKFLEGKKG